MTMQAPPVKLAILTGDPPAFPSPRYVGRPNLGNRERFLDRVNGILDRRWFTNAGPLTVEFEDKLAAYLGVKHCVTMCNATVGLEIAIRAADLRGEVIVPSFTFIATAHALQWQQVTPVFCDIDPLTHCLDPRQVERAITPRTTGIVGVHLWGRPCPVEALGELARRHHLTLLFDAAHAFGCSHQGRMIGGFGEAEVFSFHATKFFNTFEGGAVTSNDDAFAAKVRLMRNFGFTGYDQVTSIGTNGKMTEIAAAMGLTGLENLSEFVAINRRNYEAYRDQLAGLAGLVLLRFNGAERGNYQYVVVEVDEGVAALARDELIAVLHAENVLARRYFWPGCHNLEPYRSLFPLARDGLPATERVARRVLVLPTGTGISLKEIGLVCSLIRSALDQSSVVRQMLRQTSSPTAKPPPPESASALPA